MSTSNRIGWALIALSISSWTIEAITASLLHVRFSTLIAWTYITLGVLLVGIFMAQYKPYTEE